MCSFFTHRNFTFSLFRIFIAIGLLFVGLTVQQKSTTAQTIDWRVKRQGLEFQFGQDLVKISDWCNRNGLVSKRAETHALKQNRDLNRQYLFVPQSEAMPDPEQQDGKLKEWREKINAARVAHAGRIFELAKEALAADATAIAYQLLYEVIHQDRDHAEVRRILGHELKKDGSWHVASTSFKFRPSNKDHRFLSLGKGQYHLAETAHFKIVSTASEARTRVLAEELELWHTVWRQVFFDYWGSKTTLTGSFAGQKTMRIPGRKFDVVFFQNKQQYANLLEEHVRGVGISSGYYSNKLRTSFFYDGDIVTQQTWRHELTHQLFRQSKGRRPDNVFDKNHVWIDEGVATYAESMAKFDNYVTLGGFEAQRTQYARLHALLTSDAKPVANLNSMTKDNWQAQGNAKLYSQSAAIVDTLMNENHGQHQPDFIDLLQVIYYKQAPPESFENKLKLSFAQVDQMFLNFLKIDSNMVSKYLSKPKMRTFLSFSGAKLVNGDYQKIGECINLEVLDLSGHVLNKNDLQPLANCPALRQLILVRCQFGPGALLELGKLPGLSEIDLSLSQIGPTQANEINQLRQLKPGLKIKQ